MVKEKCTVQKNDWSVYNILSSFVSNESFKTEVNDPVQHKAGILPF